MIEFIHPVLDEEVTAIGGYYKMAREDTLVFNGKDVLYLIGYAVVDTSCCGATGCGYAVVPGYIVSLHAKRTPDDRSISLVEPLEEQVYQEIARTL
ncbi:MAG: hypothetical protein JW920_06930, partial [Deltaproteobacteria bacterium]|nr:hypothetical protein [Deltaproteobacteria bacterium]